MIYADALVGTTNGQTNTALFAESIEGSEDLLKALQVIISSLIREHKLQPVLFIWNGRRRWNEFRYNWTRLSI